MMTTLTQPNTLYQYRGGGYDGCFWEWNYAYIDQSGKFHDLYSTGYKGAKTLEDLESHIETHNKTEWSFERLYTYNMASPEALEELATENNAANLLIVAGAMRKLGFKIMAPCSCCANSVVVTNCIGDNPQWSGGLAYYYKDLICGDCQDNYTCCNCGEFIGDDSENWNQKPDSQGYCIWCEPETDD